MIPFGTIRVFVYYVYFRELEEVDALMISSSKLPMVTVPKIMTVVLV